MVKNVHISKDPQGKFFCQNDACKTEPLWIFLPPSMAGSKLTGPGQKKKKTPPIVNQWAVGFLCRHQSNLQCVVDNHGGRKPLIVENLRYGRCVCLDLWRFRNAFVESNKPGLISTSRETPKRCNCGGGGKGEGFYILFRRHKYRHWPAKRTIFSSGAGDNCRLVRSQNSSEFPVPLNTTNTPYYFPKNGDKLGCELRRKIYKMEMDRSTRTDFYRISSFVFDFFFAFRLTLRILLVIKSSS